MPRKKFWAVYVDGQFESHGPETIVADTLQGAKDKARNLYRTDTDNPSVHSAVLFEVFTTFHYAQTFKEAPEARLVAALLTRRPELTELLQDVMRGVMATYSGQINRNTPTGPFATVNRLRRFLIAKGSHVVYKGKRMRVENVDTTALRLTCKYKSRLVRDIPMDAVEVEN